MKIIHIMPREKFTERFVNFIFSNFDFSEHFFFLTGEYTEYNINQTFQSHITWVTNYRELYQNQTYKNMLLECEKIIINGVWGSEMMLFYFPRYIRKKTYLFFWGADIYGLREKIPFREIRKRCKRAARKYLIKNVGGIVTLIQGDFDVLQKYVKVKGNHFVARMASNKEVYEMQEALLDYHKPTDPYYVLLGNSATASNRHYEMIDLVIKYKDSNIKFLCPLSYGDMDYARDVIAYGNEKLGDSFVPLTEFMEAREYYQLLNKCSAGIFNNDRQQALGNILALLRFGAKVYLREGTSMWEFLKEKGMLVYNMEQLSDDFVNPSEEMQCKNHNAIIEYFKIENAVREWETVFHDTGKKRK